MAIRINIASSGRFHVLDLARELDALGMDVKFYSHVPPYRARAYGLKVRCSASLFYVMLPFLVLARLWPPFRPRVVALQDWLTALVMRPCDVFIAMSGNYIYSLKVAKRKGAVIIVERGSKHILEQRRILEAIPSLHGTKPVPDVHVQRELECYSLADYISVASSHVRDSFLMYGLAPERIFVNPYGVELADFAPMPEISRHYDVIMVGTWSYQKGVDLLENACRTLGLSLLHVGQIGDVPFPFADKGFTHVDAVDQKLLKNYYAQARVMALPSRQDGLALVQAQAIACGLPIVCSEHTGGRDLVPYVGSEWVYEMREYSVDALTEALRLAIDHAPKLINSLPNLKAMSWQSYAERYSEFIGGIVKQM